MAQYQDPYGEWQDSAPEESLDQIWARYNKQFEGLGENQQYVSQPLLDAAGNDTGQILNYVAPKSTSVNPLSFKDAVKTTFSNLTNFKGLAKPWEGGNPVDPAGGIAAFAGNKETQPFDYFTVGPLSKDQDFRDASRMVGRIVAGNVAAGAAGLGGAEAGATGQAPIAGGEGVDALSSGGNVGEFDWLDGLDMGGGYDPGMGGGYYDSGGGIAVDEFGNTTGGMFAGGPGTAGAGDFAGTGGGLDLAAIAKQFGPAVARALPSILGAYGANKQTGALQTLAGQYQNFGAPSRMRYEQSMSPGFDPNSIPGYAGALDSASKAVLAKLSASGGNPFGNPGGLIDAQKQIVSGTAMPAINEFQRLNAATGFGQTLNSAGGFGQNAIGSQANVYNAVGAGINDVLNPPQTLAQQLAALKQAGLYSPNSLG